MPNEKIVLRYSELNQSQWHRLERGEITIAQVKINRYKLLFNELGVQADAVKVAAAYEKNLSLGHYFVEGAPDLIKSLYGKYRLYIMSNGALAVQKSRLASSKIEGFFDDIFISEEIGFSKPSRNFFEGCFSQIDNFSRKESVIIGDSLTSDIKGGKNAEIHTIWFNAKSLTADIKLKPDFTVKSLGEVPEILNSL